MDKAKKQKNKAAETIKSVVLVLLFCLMLFLTVINTAIVRNNGLVSSSSLNLRSQLILKTGSETDEETVKSFLAATPEFIGYRQGDVRRGIYSGSELVRYIYSMFAEPLSDFMGKNGRLTVHEENEGEVLWKRCIESENYIYFKYHTALSAPLIYAYSGETVNGSVNSSAEGEINRVSELFLVRLNSSTGECRVVIRTPEGKICEYKTVSENSDYDISWLSAYNDNKEFINYVFFAECGTDQKNITLTDTTVMTSESFSMPSIYFKSANDGKMLSSEKKNGLIKLFGLSPDKTNEIKSNDGVMFIGSSGSILISNDGYIEYTAAGMSSGVSVSEYLGYVSYSGEYSFDESLRSTASLMTMLNNIISILPDKITPFLSDVYVENGSLTVVYSALCDNILLVDSSGRPYEIMKILIRNGRIISVSARISEIVVSDDKSICLPELWTYDRLSEKYAEAGAVSAAMKPVYVIDTQKTENAAVYASWCCFAE